MKSQNVKTYVVNVLISFVACVLIILMGLWAESHTYGMEGDEMFSFISSTSLGGFKGIGMSLEDQTWYDSDYFHEALIATGSERFNMPMVWENQAMDVHPPLFYVLLNIVCSIFTGTYSRWLGVGLNIGLNCILCLSLALLIRYLLKAARLVSDEYVYIVSIIIAAIFCCSKVAIGQVLFIRMYVLMMIFATLSAWWHIKSFDDEPAKKDYVLLALITIGGGLTHYYYLVLVALFAFFFVIGEWFAKRKKAVVSYIVTMILSAALDILIYPAMISHMFIKYRGRDAVHKFLKESSLFGDFIDMVKSYSAKQFLGGFVVCILVVLAIEIMLIHALIKHKISRISFIKAIVVESICTIYFYGIAKASPFVTVRYVSAVTPLMFAMIFIAIIWLVDRNFNLNMKWTTPIICLLSFVLCFGFSKENYKADYFKIRDEVVANIGKEVDSCVYITASETNWEMWEDYENYSNFDRLFFIEGLELNPINDDDLKSEESLCVFINNKLNYDEVIDYLKEYLSFENYDLEYQSAYTYIVRAI